MLQENVDVFVWWLFQVTRLSQSKPASREQLIRQFVLEWTYISTQILKLVTFISPAALGREQFSRFNASIFFWKFTTVKLVKSDTCVICFTVLSHIDFHALLTILFMFYTVKSDTLSIPSQKLVSLWMSDYQ